MQCKSCGTEIADKAIICYRCGAGTADPVRKAVPIRPRRGLLPAALAAVILLIGALYMGQASRTAADPEQWQTIAGVLAGAAVLLLVVRVIRRPPSR